jgi:hypothetical protein
LRAGIISLRRHKRDTATMPNHPARPACDRLAHLAPALLALALFSGCATTPAPAPAPTTRTGLQPFRSDGCSSFPDRALIGHADWRHCCVAHDHAYWRGGTADQRLQADEALRACVRQASGNPALAQLMFLGVRAGGRPELNTTYRWGYGWPPGRPYGALSADETAEADALEQQAVPATCAAATGSAKPTATTAPARSCDAPATPPLTAPQTPAP